MIDPTDAADVPTPSLSLRGAARRDRILDLARGAARRRRQRRRAGRAVAAAAVVIAVSTAVGVIVRRPSGSVPGRGPGRELAIPVVPPHGATVPTLPAPSELATAPTIPPQRKAKVSIARLTTEAGIVDRLALRPRAAAEPRRLSDDELLDRLAEAGRPAGLAYVDGRAVLLYHDKQRDALR